MIGLGCVFAVVAFYISPSHCSQCEVKCTSDDTTVCGFHVANKTYHVFPSKCAMDSLAKCSEVEIVRTDMLYCIKSHFPNTRRDYGYGESCPVFCPNYYRPVCGASKMRDYVYRAFTNGCQMDMLNCRGDDFSGYVEVPLSFCPNHAMKNIYKEQYVFSHLPDVRDYDT